MIYIFEAKLENQLISYVLYTGHVLEFASDPFDLPQVLAHVVAYGLVLLFRDAPGNRVRVEFKYVGLGLRYLLVWMWRFIIWEYLAPLAGYVANLDGLRT